MVRHAFQKVCLCTCLQPYLNLWLFFAATVAKIIKELLPKDIRVAKDSQELITEAAMGEPFLRPLGCMWVCMCVGFLETFFAIFLM